MHGVEGLASFEPCDGSLQCFKPLVVVALGRDDRRVTEEVADLSKRNVALDQPRGVLVPQVVPVQVDFPEPLLALRC